MFFYFNSFSFFLFQQFQFFLLQQFQFFLLEYKNINRRAILQCVCYLTIQYLKKSIPHPMMYIICVAPVSLRNPIRILLEEKTAWRHTTKWDNVQLCLCGCDNSLLIGKGWLHDFAVCVFSNNLIENPAFFKYRSTL